MKGKVESKGEICSKTSAKIEAKPNAKPNAKKQVSSGIQIVVLAVGLLATSLPSWAAGKIYPVQVPSKFPKPYAAYKKIVPVAWRKASWVYTLQGTAEPVRTIDFKGKKFLIGHVCKPHDCGGNQLTFLMSMDGSEAYAFANSFDLTHTEDVMVGAPDPETIKVLRKGLE